MANLGNTFDATTIDPLKPHDVLPAGRYGVQIVDSEMRVTKDGMGQYLWLELDVLEGEYAGRKLFDRLNLVNNNPVAVEIAQRTLSSICHAVGRLQVADSGELHLIPMIADVKVKPPQNGYGESNTLRYLPLEDKAATTAPAQPPAPAQATPQPAPAPAPTAPVTGNASATPPWKRNV